jgi:UPF0755 protein
MAPTFPKGLMPHPRTSSQQKRSRRAAPAFVRKALPLVATTFIFVVGFFSLPLALAVDLELEKGFNPKPDFPVTVDPANKVIIEDPAVEAMLERPENGSLTAAVGKAGDAFTWLASMIADLPLYQQIAGSDTVFVTIYPGFRQEEVSMAFASKLGWTAKQRAEFLKDVKTLPPTLAEGQFVPGTYAVSALAKPVQVQAMIYDQFQHDIVSRYSTTTAQIVPIDQALTIASLLEREAGADDMRLISGIIWNRLFKGMNLQIDATLQYAKANQTKTTTSWWPTATPKDKYIKSPYNTYQNKGLPPGPIASPSVAAVLAALNPKKTDCLFYFHDTHGKIYCSADYKEHVKLLKQVYGQGK